jgi:uridine phosphorylase
MQGSSKRAAVLAKKLAKRVLNIDSTFFEPVNLAHTSNFAIYRVGKILSVSHGMGNVTIDALLHVLTKLLYFAGNTEVEYIRVGTSGGIGVKPGTVVVTKNAFMPNLAPYYTTYELDKRVDTPTALNHELVARILAAQPQDLPFDIVSGNSIAADDFYLGQCRYDGAMIARKDRNYREGFFKQVHELGICNFEMESTALAAFCHQAQIPATMIAVTLVNRFEGDQITATAEQLGEYSDRSQQVVINYILSRKDLV